jgi:hypothetical protein
MLPGSEDDQLVTRNAVLRAAGRWLSTVSRQLTAALQGTALDAAHPEQARTQIGSVREAWRGLTPDGQKRHRLEALAMLDQFMWKVHRRRPAQAHLGSELEFAGL